MKPDDKIWDFELKNLPKKINWDKNYEFFLANSIWTKMFQNLIYNQII